MSGFTLVRALSGGFAIRGRATALLAAILTAAVLHVPHTAQAKDICRSFDAQPEKLFDLDLRGSDQFEDTGSGVYITFGGNRQILSVFKFDENIDRISDEMVAAILSGSERAIENGAIDRGDAILSGPERFSWPLDGVTFHGVGLKASHKQDNLEAFEYVGVSHDTVCLLKVRYTDAASSDAGESLARYRAYVERAQDLFR